MRSKRLFWFVVMIGLGVMLGLLYGWVISPVKYTDTSPNSLSKDYKADYILMVAEIYHSDGNLEQATRRLALLSAQPPGQIVNEGIFTAQELGYGSADLERMKQLAQDLQGPSAQATPGGLP